MPRLAHLLASNLLVTLALVASGCSPDVVGGTRPVEDDCSFGCEVEQEDPSTGSQQAAGTGATTTTTAGQGGAGGQGGGSGGTSGEGGAGGGDGSGGATGTGGAGGAGGA